MNQVGHCVPCKRHAYISLFLALDALSFALLVTLSSLLCTLFLLLADFLSRCLSLSLAYLLKLLLMRALSLTGRPPLPLALNKSLLLRARTQLVQVNLFALGLC